MDKKYYLCMQKKKNLADKYDNHGGLVDNLCSLQIKHDKYNTYMKGVDSIESQRNL